MSYDIKLRLVCFSLKQFSSLRLASCQASVTFKSERIKHVCRAMFCRTRVQIKTCVKMSVCSLKTSLTKWKPDYDSAASEYGKAGNSQTSEYTN